MDRLLSPNTHGNIYTYIHHDALAIVTNFSSINIFSSVKFLSNCENNFQSGYMVYILKQISITPWILYVLIQDVNIISISKQLTQLLDFLLHYCVCHAHTVLLINIHHILYIWFCYTWNYLWYYYTHNINTQIVYM